MVEQIQSFFQPLVLVGISGHTQMKQLQFSTAYEIHRFNCSRSIALCGFIRICHTDFSPPRTFFLSFIENYNDLDYGLLEIMTKRRHKKTVFSGMIKLYWLSCSFRLQYECIMLNEYVYSGCKELRAPRIF